MSFLNNCISNQIYNTCGYSNPVFIPLLIYFSTLDKCLAPLLAPFFPHTNFVLFRASFSPFLPSCMTQLQVLHYSSASMFPKKTAATGVLFIKSEKFLTLHLKDIIIHNNTFNICIDFYLWLNHQEIREIFLQFSPICRCKNEWEALL